MKSIVWLASYPKSGNTWLRVFLANYIINSDKPVPINDVHKIGIGDSNSKAYQKVMKVPFDPTNPQLCAKVRPVVLQGIVNNKADVNLVKTHNENSAAFGIKLIPPELTRSAIYIMRNPLDMIISYANHYNLTIDAAIEGISRKSNTLQGGGESAFQFLGSWSNHVIGWTKARKFPLLTLRYEDMLVDPIDSFSKVIEHIGLPLDGERLEKSVKFSEFKELQKQENENSFVEKSDTQEKFFRSGKSGQWKNELTQEQIDLILRDQGRVMKKFGYEV